MRLNREWQSSRYEDTWLLRDTFYESKASIMQIIKAPLLLFIYKNLMKDSQTPKRILLARRVNVDASPNSSRLNMFSEPVQGNSLIFKNNKPVPYSYVGRSKNLKDKFTALAKPQKQVQESFQEQTELQTEDKEDITLLTFLNQNKSIQLKKAKLLLSSVSRNERNYLTRQQRKLQRLNDYKLQWQNYEQKMAQMGFKNPCTRRAQQRLQSKFDPTQRFQSFRDDNLASFWQMGLRNNDKRIFGHLQGIPHNLIIQKMLLKRDSDQLNRNMPSLPRLDHDHLQQLSLKGSSKLIREMAKNSSLRMKAHSALSNHDQTYQASLQGSRLAKMTGFSNVRLGEI